MSDLKKQFEEIIKNSLDYSVPLPEMLYSIMRQAYDLAKPSVQVQGLIDKYEKVLNNCYAPNEKFYKVFLADLRTLKESEVAETKWINVKDIPDIQINDMQTFWCYCTDKKVRIMTTIMFDQMVWVYGDIEYEFDFVTHVTQFIEPTPPEPINTLNK